ncbi:MAG: WD40 domain-containing protein [Desulfobacterales bacterium]|nr:WD40 domain-containing protein [Desulfobacterales bacterium]
MNAVAFSPDSRQVVSGSDDMTVRIWDAATANPSEPLKDMKAVFTVSPSAPTANRSSPPVMT